MPKGVSIGGVESLLRGAMRIGRRCRYRDGLKKAHGLAGGRDSGGVRNSLPEEVGGGGRGWANENGQGAGEATSILGGVKRGGGPRGGPGSEAGRARGGGTGPGGSRPGGDQNAGGRKGPGVAISGGVSARCAGEAGWSGAGVTRGREVSRGPCGKRASAADRKEIRNQK